MRGRNKPWAKDFIAAHEELRFNKEENVEILKVAVLIVTLKSKNYP